MTTTDLRNTLENFYQDNIQRALEAIQEEYESFDCESNSDKIIDSSEELKRIGINVEIEGEAVELIVGFQSTFPDTLPRLYLTNNEFDKYSPLPHLQSNGFLCTRDPNVVDINEHKVEEATLKIIEIAIEDLKKNIGKGFNEEFKREFLAYWEDQATYSVLFLSQIKDDVKLLNRYLLSQKLGSTKSLIADDDEKVKHWTKSLGIEYSDENDEVLFIPIGDIEFIPQNNSDVYKIFSELSKDTIQEIDRYYKRSKTNSTILFSLTYGGKLVAGFVHKKWNKEVFKGFRGNAVPFKIRLKKSRFKEIDKLKVINVNENRLLNRGGYDKLDGQTLGADLKIVGCGSVGSKISMSIAQAGVSRFSLVDPENLKPENIHRHLCGFSSLLGRNRIPKVEAVKKHIENHLPYVNISTYDKDVLKLLLERDDFFDDGDCIVVATADRSVERRLNSLIRQSGINVDLIILWLGPYGIGGNLIYVDPDCGGCYQCCFDKNQHFIYSFAEEGQRFNKREAGCQSTFVPYSNIELEQFVSISAGVIIDILRGDVDSSRIYSWYLNSQPFKSEGYRISDYWLTAEKLSSKDSRLEPNPECQVCSDE